MLRYQDHIRIFHMEAEESRGPTLARANQQTLIQDEEFCLELDAHSILLLSWDTKIIADWARADNEMAVLSTYIEGLEHIQSDGETHVQEDQAPHLCRAAMDSKFFRNQGAANVLNSRTPMMSPFWGAGKPLLSPRCPCIERENRYTHGATCSVDDCCWLMEGSACRPCYFM